MVYKSKCLCDIHLSTIRTSDHWHLLNASTHGCPWDVSCVSPLIQVVVHGNVEQVIAHVSSFGIIGIIRESKTVAVGRSFSIIITTLQYCEAVSIEII